MRRQLHFVFIMALCSIGSICFAQQKATGSIGLAVDLSNLVVNGNKLKYEMKEFRPSFIVIAIDTAYRFLRADAGLEMKDTVKLKNLKAGVYDIKFFDATFNLLGADYIIYSVKSVVVRAGKQTDIIIKAEDINVIDTVDMVYNNLNERPVCSRCHKNDKTLPIAYGLIREIKPRMPARHRKYIAGGCIPSDPKWYCTRDRCYILKYYW